MNSLDLTWLWSSLIGVGATLGGVLLGWIISRKKNTKINLEVREYCQHEPHYAKELNDKYSSFRSLEIYFKIFIYNPSDYIKVIKDLRFQLIDETNVCKEFKITVIDEHNFLISSHARYRDLVVINVPQNCAVILGCDFHITNSSFNSFKNAKQIYLVYTDEKGKVRKTKFTYFKDLEKIEMTNDATSMTYAKV